MALITTSQRAEYAPEQLKLVLTTMSARIVEPACVTLPLLGKTLLAAEFLVRGAVQFNEPGVLMAFEETEAELKANVASLGFDLAGLVRVNRLAEFHGDSRQTHRVVEGRHLHHFQRVRFAERFDKRRLKSALLR